MTSLMPMRPLYWYVPIPQQVAASQSKRRTTCNASRMCPPEPAVMSVVTARLRPGDVVIADDERGVPGAGQ